MPTQKLRMGPIGGAVGSPGDARLVDHSFDAFDVIYVARQRNPQIILKCDQPSIEHPMHGPRQCKSIAHNIGAICFDGLDMCGLNFGSPAAIDQTKPGKGTALSVSAEDEFAEYSVTNDARSNERRTSPVVENKGLRFVPKATGSINVIIARQDVGLGTQTKVDNASKVFW